MKRNKKLLITLFLIISIGLLVLISLSKYFLFSDSTSRFQDYLSQVDGLKVVITSDGKEILRTDLLKNNSDAFSQVTHIFRSVKLRPALRPKLEKLLSGKANMTNSVNTGVIVRILLFQQGEQLHSIHLGGSNEIYFDDLAFGVGDLSRVSESEIIIKILALFVNDAH